MTALVAVLGAGRASRFGTDKLVQPCAGRPLGSWALSAARATGLPVVWIARTAAPDFVDCEVATNPDAQAGIGTSVACAARIAAEQGATRLLVMLADMPLVSRGLLLKLLAANAPAASDHGDRAGVPAVLPASLFGRLQALTGDAGAGSVLQNHSDLTLVTTAPHELLDVDTPAALAEAERLLRAR